MKKFLLLIIIFLNGCSGSVKKSYYRLPHTNSIEKKIVLIGKKQAVNNEVIFISSIDLFDDLNSNNIQFQVDEVQYISAQNHLWSTPLKQQLRHLLVHHLSKILPHYTINFTAQPSNTKAIALTFKVDHFHGRYDGQVVVAGSFLLAACNHTLQNPFYFQLPQSEDGYASLVKTLAKGWQLAAQQAATTLTKEVNSLCKNVSINVAE